MKKLVALLLSCRCFVCKILYNSYSDPEKKVGMYFPFEILKRKNKGIIVMIFKRRTTRINRRSLRWQLSIAVEKSSFSFDHITEAMIHE